jgi:hypothetical protein
MAKRTPGLVINEKGEDFVLRRTNAAGRTFAMTLTENDILTLVQSAQRLRDRILARRSRPGFDDASSAD